MLENISWGSVSAHVEVSLKCVLSCLNKDALICTENTEPVLLRFGVIFLGKFSGAFPSLVPDYQWFLNVR